MTLKVLLIMLYLKKVNGLNDMTYVWILSLGERGYGYNVEAVFNRKPSIRTLNSFTQSEVTSKILKKLGVHTVGCEQWILEKHKVYNRNETRIAESDG